ncbi:MAG TPA: flavodoxin [Gammaproteobacteria bacterium]|jgi:flavodoxin|nr:flavodoxin [Gammaproteobacteria bacterium]
MAKTLVVYYSRTGHTRTVALEIAAHLDADVEEICEPGTERRGVFGYLRSAREALRGQLPRIVPIRVQPAAYDLVIVGTPVWASHMASPVRSYLHAHGRAIGRLAAFCTQGGSGGPKVLAEVAQLCGRETLATLVLNERDVTRERFVPQLEAFVSSLVKQLSAASAASSGTVWHTAAT